MSEIDLLTTDPDAVAAKIAESLESLRHRADEMVYHPAAEHSYYRDFLASRGIGESPGARDRLARHAEQMERVRSERRDRAARMERSGAVGFERRATPDRTDGLGGYFSPPVWLDQLFATANRPGRVLAGLMPTFPLPDGVSSVNVPVIGAGTVSQPVADDASAPDGDLTDTLTTSAVVPIVGQADVAVQLLELAPHGGMVDWAISMDLAEGYDASLEQQLLAGAGTAAGQLVGVLSAGGSAIAYTDAAPSGKALYPLLGEAFAQVGDKRNMQPQCWLMRSARWAWLMTQEDASNRPYGLDTGFYLGSDDSTPDPVSGLLGIPVFLDEAVPATLSGNPGAFTAAAGSQDAILCLRPHDMILLEGEPRAMVAREPLSGEMGVRLQQRRYVAALTGRRPAGIAVVSGTGLAVQPGF